MVWRSPAAHLLLVAVFYTARAFDADPIIRSQQEFPNVKMPYISPKQMEQAFVQAGQDAQQRIDLENNLVKHGNVIPRGSMTAEARHQRFTAIDPKTIQMDANQKVFEGASNALIDMFKLTDDQIIYGLPRVNLPAGSKTAYQVVQSCQSNYAVGQCDSKTIFRTADGSCNNLDNPLWGKSFTCFERLVPPDYADALGSPRLALSGIPLPNPRIVSTTIHDDIDIPATGYTLMTMQWGQFMDHDITLTPMTRTGSMDMIECCPLDGTQKHPACFPIELPPDDKFFSVRGQSCLNFVRSAACDATCSLGPRQQTNQLTAFIDASNVYGSETNNSNSLRTFRDGLLKSQDGDLLPPSIDPENDQCSRQEGQQDCFHAGDERVNEQPGLTCMHTVWLRQHNRYCKQLRALRPDYSDETLYQICRKIVGAQLQAITYGEFLPVVLGPYYMSYFHLGLQPYSTFTEYEDYTNPTVFHEFATAAYRFGHTLIQNGFSEVNSAFQTYNSLNLSENFFFPFALFRGELPDIVRGLFISPAQQYDRHIVAAVTNNLYKQRGSPFGMDLPALNLQRGRDHGINGYTTYLNYCFGEQIQDFKDLKKFMIDENWQKLSSLYENVADIDLFTGGVAETPLTGGVVGPTFGCIIGTQFYHLKFGDRFYFEHDTSGFTLAQINQIKRTKLARVLCDNSPMTEINYNVFLPPDSTLGTRCEDLDTVDVSYFQFY